MATYMVTQGLLKRSRGNVIGFPLLIITLFCFGLVFAAEVPAKQPSAISQRQSDKAAASQQLPTISVRNNPPLPLLLSPVAASAQPGAGTSMPQSTAADNLQNAALNSLNNAEGVVWHKSKRPH